MENMIYFSIIVPIYNIEKYLKQCLDSIQKQTYKEFEVILVEDGSPDRAPQICDAYVENDPRFCVIHKKNEGLVRARKTGVAKAKGKYIIFVDGDDWIDEQMLERLHAVLEDASVDMVALGFYQEFEKKTLEVSNIIRPDRYKKEQLKSRVYPHMMCMGLKKNILMCGIAPSVWSKVFRREIVLSVIEKIDDRITMGEDAACTYPCLIYADSLIVLDERFYHYRYVDSSMSQKHDIHYFEKIGFLFDYFDEASYPELDSQLQKYKMFLFLLGVRQMMREKKHLYKKSRELRRICNQEKFHNLLVGFLDDSVDFKNRQLISWLKQSKFTRISACYWIKRKYVIMKHAVKKMLYR